MADLFPPFEPDAPEPPRRRFQAVPLRLLLPNLVTLLALCAGLTGIRMAIEGRLEVALAAIVLAAVLDGLDGRLARMLHGTSRFGAELDSLSDFVCFGVAPGLVLYMWGLETLGSVGWIAALAFAICAALRLARFNVMLEDPNKPPFAGDFFTGVPAPAGAICVLLPVYLELIGLPRLVASPAVAAFYCLALALLMVSKVPAYSGKRLGARVPRDKVLPLFVCVVLFVAVLVTWPWTVLSVICVAYLVALPFSAVRYGQLKRAYEKRLVTTGAGGPHAPPAGDEPGDRPGHLN
ncbi:CDP-diacylglycerol--serine O-phosphatidyltransferase [Ancylobacter dichloromethanicus]|uniref:CDP-diacylglycerol--serine O-phosphatidyltransferase n=1 Tax=Ancylobacter dichloromethanicus TaxID=518825 RepID=A0A9W6J6L7_9HYPH|nr:CDP-diacylglycerol--serine O-phosphatidyltransferase [Ancylobacter dichloromethanicus]MBS7553043.1 CDP-diacylglycerol--serine O-phosphatidyltransferase [Ancylobacter dichloromethanicus]GLK70364.1 CDP-diacylglycerol--serine O-phosphatidyltransferase [Ancylobacter dichloromethanicus]